MVRRLALALFLLTCASFAGCCATPCDPISPGNPCLADVPPVDPCEHPCRPRWWAPLQAERCCVWSPVPDPCAPAWDVEDPCYPRATPCAP